MNLDRRAAVALAQAIARHADGVPGVDVAVVPPFVYLEAVAGALAGSRVVLGGQDCCDRPSGAFTGEVSAAMLRDVGARVVVIGHSERRHVYLESDALVRAKVEQALKAGLSIILCIGETLAERQAGRTEEVVRRHVTQGLSGLGAAEAARLTLAYEPVWAIGTGVNAAPAQAAEVHAYVRGLLRGLFGDRVADATRIQYGGSVKPDNASELLAAPDVDGALVGGAALEPKSFLPILDAAQQRTVAAQRP
jgi:triosephosphate isomerase